MNFKDRVFKAVEKVPKGRVVSYGQVAAFCGSPRSARQVGWMLRLLDEANLKSKTIVPWWRVINAHGQISIKGNLISTPLAQKNFLESEGVVVSKDYKVDFDKYRFYFSPVTHKKL